MSPSWTLVRAGVAGVTGVAGVVAVGASAGGGAGVLAAGGDDAHAATSASEIRGEVRIARHPTRGRWGGAGVAIALHIFRIVRPGAKSVIDRAGRGVPSRA